MPAAPPRRWSGGWWAPVLAVVALGLFGVGFVVRYRCLTGECPPAPLAQWLDLDALGSLPRSFTSWLFVAVAVLAWRARPDADPRRARWWAAVAAIGVGLALAKAISVHSAAKSDLAAGGTLLLGIVVAVPVLVALEVTGRRRRVTGARAVTVALALYAAASLGLDLLTELAGAVQDSIGPLTLAASTLVEELGEALTALGVLAVVHHWADRGPGPARPAAVDARPSPPATGPAWVVGGGRPGPEE